MRPATNHSKPRAGSVDTLRSILERADRPEELDRHPWTTSPIVNAALAAQPDLERASPGRRLLLAITNLFAERMPSVPPRRGLRLDTRWGEFGVLAARYFAPLKYGLPFPTSMRDAWGRIDHAILLFVYGREAASLSTSEVARYRLVGGEQEVAPESTLSDWHRKGLQRLAAAVDERQTRLEQDSLTSATAPKLGSPAVRRRRKELTAAGALALLLVLLTVFRAYRAYTLAQKVRGDLLHLAQVLPSSLSVQAAKDLSAQLPVLARDVDALHAEAAPLLWFGPLFGWVPTYGGDISQSGYLLDLARHLLNSAEVGDRVVSPLLDSPASGESQLSFDHVVSVLVDAQPQLTDARREFTAAQAARARIHPERLSPRIREVLVNRVDPAMGWIDDGLSLGVALPALLGAGPNGPKTYLVLAQNEDELRASGGLITEVGKLVVDRGNVIDMSFENSSDVDNWSMPYPMAPSQLQDYMNSRVLVLRDSNWFPDFPTALLYVRQLYAYADHASVDGVIAFDQQLLVMVLKAIGPIQVAGLDHPVDSGNVIQYMREAKVRPTPGPGGYPAGSTSAAKAFVGTLAQVILSKVKGSQTPDWQVLATVALQALEQHHLLLQIDEPDAQAVLARHDWNGAISSNSGDFLMVLDTNVGFNKTNAVVKTTLSYEVDLTHPASPKSELVITHSNGAAADVPCVQWDRDQTTAETSYPIDRCYWDYMRVYAPQATELLDATPQTIPDSWMILNRHVVPRVDVLDEGLPGLASFGTMLVVPGGGEVTTSMHFALPASSVLLRNPDGSLTYSLKLKKQPGTLAVPITVSVQLPTNATLLSHSPGGTTAGNTLMFAQKLQVDQQVNVVFRLP